MDRTALRRELVALIVTSVCLGLFAFAALSRESFFARDEPWWVHLLGANLIFVLLYTILARLRRLLAATGVRESP